MTEKEVSRIIARCVCVGGGGRIIARFLALENGWRVMPFFKMGKLGEEACMWGDRYIIFFKLGLQRYNLYTVNSLFLSNR